MLRIPIGITGSLNAGKDTLADMMMSYMEDTFEKYSMAKPMKDMSIDIFGFTPEQMYDPDKKAEKDIFWDITPRKFLQLLGTDMFRNHFRDDVWVKLAERRMRQVSGRNKHILVPDIRFDNEAAFIMHNGGWLFKIVRDDDSYKESRNHISESGVSEEYVNGTIYNNGSLDSLRGVAEYLCKYVIFSQDSAENTKLPNLKITKEPYNG